MTKATKLIFVGGVTQKSRLRSATERSIVPLQFAAENFQWSFISGVEENIGSPMCVISAPFYSSYPFNHRDYYVKGFSYSHCDGATDVSVGYLNFPGVKNIFKFFGLTKGVVSATGVSDRAVVFVYSTNLAYVAAAVLAKVIRRNISLCVIVTDLPEFPGDCSIFYRAYLKFIEAPIFYRILGRVDKFVTLTRYIPNALGVPNQKCITVEGLFDISSDYRKNEEDCPSKDNKIILYTGTLDRRYGAIDLIEAFKKVNDESFELWICGGGGAIAEVIQASKADSRIKYLGLKSREDILHLQKKCDLLINPRTNTGDYNKYSFPSKTIEYMASGSPMLSYRIDGIPDEYYKYIYTVNDLDGESLTDAILRVFSLGEKALAEQGKAAKLFIYQNKGSKAQTRRVLDFVFN